MHFYNIHSYGGMIRDSIRTDAYARALRECVTPDSVVLDMGTGVGIWAMLACQYGARKVYAVDPNNVIQIAREFAAANGCADRIEFIQDMTTRISLPEQADVIVASMQGILPMFEQNLTSIIDARNRLLAPGGRMIPEQETLWAVPVESQKCYDEFAMPWSDNSYGLDLRRGLRFTTNQWHRPKNKVTPEQFFAEPACWATLDYRIPESPSVIGRASWTAVRAGTGHGVVVWFETHLMEGVSFSNAPGAPELIFGNGFFPWKEPVSISAGDTISVELRADLFGNDYIWSWATVVLNKGRAKKPKARFKQSTILGKVAASTNFHKRAHAHVPKLGEDGQVQRFVLSLMDGKNSIETIATRTVAKFSDRFFDRKDALTLAADLSETFSA